MGYLEVKNLYLKKGDFELKNITFSIEKGDFLSIIGRTGSGKTVLLETVAGIHKPKGKIVLEGRDITKTPIEKRGIGLVYQDFMLFEHMSVKENLLFPKNRDMSLYNRLIEQFGLGKLLSRRPKNLSGGEKQKVAIARAILSKPKLLLLDEPLSSIDFSFRYMFLEFIKNIHREFNLTTIYVTHNLKEALNLSNRCGVLINGELLQFGKTEDVFKKPKNSAVARFLGYKNILSGKLVGLEDRLFSISPYDICIGKCGDFQLEVELISLIKKDTGFLAKVRAKSDLLYIFVREKPPRQFKIGFKKKDMVVFEK